MCAAQSMKVIPSKITRTFLLPTTVPISEAKLPSSFSQKPIHLPSTYITAYLLLSILFVPKNYRREGRSVCSPLFIDLPNQVIFSATLKGEEVGKYRGREGINNIEYIGYMQYKLLTNRDNERFLSKVADFGIKFNG